MELITIWFILVHSVGFIEPMRVYPADMVCGIDGAVVGVHVNRPVNPTQVTWPDPHVPGRHCEVDISKHVATLPLGEYHIATTIIAKTRDFGTPPESYIPHDPHTSSQWIRSLSAPVTPGKPTQFRIGGI